MCIPHPSCLCRWPYLFKAYLTTRVSFTCTFFSLIWIFLFCLLQLSSCSYKKNVVAFSDRQWTVSFLLPTSTTPQVYNTFLISKLQFFKCLVNFVVVCWHTILLCNLWLICRLQLWNFFLLCWLFVQLAHPLLRPLIIMMKMILLLIV